MIFIILHLKYNTKPINFILMISKFSFLMRFYDKRKQLPFPTQLKKQEAYHLVRIRFPAYG